MAATELVAYNELLTCFERFRDELIPVEELEQALASADLALGQLRFEFQDSLRFYEPLPEVEAQVPLVWAMFGLLQGVFERFDESLREADLEEAAHSLAQGELAVGQIFVALNRLSQAVHQVSYCESPFVNELLRVGFAYLRGGLPLEAFRERFTAFWHYHCAFLANTPTFTSSEFGQSAAYEELVLQVEASLEQQTEGLEELLEFFEGLSSSEEGSEDVEASLRLIQSATQALLASQKALQSLSERVGRKFCPRCGVDNPLAARYCSGCSGRFPETGQEVSAAIDLRSSEDGVGQMGGNIQRLVAAAESFRNQESSLEEFRAVADTFAKLLGRVVRRFESLPEVQRAGINEEQWKTFESMRAVMKLALAEMTTAQSHLGSFFRDGDFSALDAALKGFETGGQEFFRLSELYPKS